LSGNNGVWLIYHNYHLIDMLWALCFLAGGQEGKSTTKKPLLSIKLGLGIIAQIFCSQGLTVQLFSGWSRICETCACCLWKSLGLHGCYWAISKSHV